MATDTSRVSGDEYSYRGSKAPNAGLNYLWKKVVSAAVTCLVIVLLLLALAFLCWLGGCQSTGCPMAVGKPQERAATAPAGKTRYTKTIVAKPGEWSEAFMSPWNSWVRIHPEGRVKIRTKAGNEWEDAPGKNIWRGDDCSIADSTFEFRSLEDKEVNVVVKWEPK